MTTVCEPRPPPRHTTAAFSHPGQSSFFFFFRAPRSAVVTGFEPAKWTGSMEAIQPQWSLQFQPFFFLDDVLPPWFFPGEALLYLLDVEQVSMRQSLNICTYVDGAYVGTDRSCRYLVASWIRTYKEHPPVSIRLHVAYCGWWCCSRGKCATGRHC